MAEWPDAISVAVEPASLVAAPRRPAGRVPATGRSTAPARDFEVEPHITVADRQGSSRSGVREAPRLAQPSARGGARRGDRVIATRSDGRWRLVWRIPLGRRLLASRREADVPPIRPGGDGSARPDEEPGPRPDDEPAAVSTSSSSRSTCTRPRRTSSASRSTPTSRRSARSRARWRGGASAPERPDLAA